MAEYAYTTVPSKLRPLLEKMRDVGVPAKATQAWLASIGFSSTNDRSLLSVLRHVGLIDPAGRPTEAWLRYREGQHDALASGIRAGFTALFETYPDAHRRSNAEIEGVIKNSAQKIGKETVSRVVSTFRHLVAMADFEPDAEEPRDVGRPEGAVTTGAISSPLAFGAPGMTLTINVQLTLPETTDDSVYEKLFAAMRTYLLEGVKDGP